MSVEDVMSRVELLEKIRRLRDQRNDERGLVKMYKVRIEKLEKENLELRKMIQATAISENGG